MRTTIERNKTKIFSFYFFIMVFCCLQSLYAQRNFSVLHFTNDNFLPQNSTSQIAFDKNNYTWITTQFGLVRYDGAHFRTYNTFNTPSIKNNRFFSVSSDVKGNIYAKDGRNVIMQVTDTGFIDRPALQLDEMFFFHAEFLHLDSLLKTHDVPLKGHEPFKKDEPWDALYYLDSVRFYFASHTHSGYFDGRQLYVFSTTDTISSFTNNGLLFTLLKNGTCNVYKNKEQIASGLNITGDIESNKAFKTEGIKHAVVSPASDSNAYIFLNRALYVLSGSKTQVISRLICDSLQINECSFIVYNASTRSYYLGSLLDGLYLLTPRDFRSLVIPASVGDDVNLRYAIIEARKNEILAFKNHLFRNEIAEPVPLKITSRFLYRDHLSHLFFQSDSLLYETDTFFHTLTTYPLSGEAVCMQEDGKGVLWFATRSEIGTLEKGTFRVYLSDSTPYREIESFIVQHDSLIWIAKRTGLFLFHVKSGRIEEIKGLTGSYVRTLKLDDDGTLWVGTYGQGFYRYKNGHLVKFPADKNGYLLIAHCLMEDRNGFFWIPTNRGLFQIKKSDLNDYADGKAKAVYYQYYDKSNGFATNEFNGGCNPCGIRISEGSFVLPSLNGLVKFNPESIHPLLPSSPIFIDKISADSISYLPFRSFILNPKFHQLVFEVSSVYYGNANNNNIEYYIRGFGDKWYPLNEDGRITITSLPHGDYELQLRKLAGFGRDNYVYKNISFAVAPEFFETTWFRLLVLLILIMLIWYGFRIRYNILKKQKLALEKQVAERTAALQQSVQKLQQSENALYSTIQQKEKITSILVHDLKSPLRFLTLVSDHIHSQIDNGNKDELKKLTQDIKQSSRRISMFTDEFLSWLLAAKEDFTSAHEIIKLKTLADETKDFFEEIIAANQNILEVNIPDDLTVIGDERLLRVIVRNLIDNANKHTRRGIIQLDGLHVNNHVEIKVKDNGNGMSAEQLKSFSDLDGNTLGFSLNVANQLGSRIIRNFIHKLGGTLTAESEVGKGTTITLIFKKSEK